MPTEQDALLAVLENLLTADDPTEARAYARLLRKPEAARRLANLDGAANLALWGREYGPRGAVRWKDLQSGRIRYSDPATGRRPGANPVNEATAAAPDPTPADVVRLAKAMLKMQADDVRALQERAGIDPDSPRYEVASGTAPGRRLLLKLLAVDARDEATSGLMTVEARRYVQGVGREALAAQTESARLSATVQWQQYQGPHGGHGWRNTLTGEIRYQEAMPHEAGPGTSATTDQAAPPRSAPANRSPGWVEARHEASQRVGRWLEEASHVPFERRSAYGHALHAVLDGMTETGLKRFLAHCQHVHFAADLPELRQHWLNVTGEGLRPGARLGGFFAHDPKTAPGEVYLDGGPDLGDDYSQTTHHVYSHELSHVLDGGAYELSRRNEWMVAWQQEIKRPDAPLSKYATVSQHEGWAEFGRLALLQPEMARQHFPRCWQTWRDLGLVEDAGVRLAAAHAPKGGVTIGGQHFPGGEFIPADVMAQATGEEKAALEMPATQDYHTPPESKAGPGSAMDRLTILKKAVILQYPEMASEVQAMTAEELDNEFDLQDALVTSPEFKSWFGDWEDDPEEASKIVDEYGYPLAVVHGGRSAAHQEFDVSYNNEPPLANGKRPWFFTNSKQVAHSYGRHVRSFYLNIRRPLDITEVAIWDAENQSRNSVFMRTEDYKKLPEWVRKASEQEGMKGETDTLEILDYLKNSGTPFAEWSYNNALKKFDPQMRSDGIISRNTLDTLGQVEDRADIYIVFDPQQIQLDISAHP